MSHEFNRYGSLQRRALLGGEFAKLGHKVGIIASKFIAPFRKGGKNDNSDAEARPLDQPSGLSQ